MANKGGSIDQLICNERAQRQRLRARPAGPERNGPRRWGRSHWGRPGWAPLLPERWGSQVRALAQAEGPSWTLHGAIL